MRKAMVTRTILYTTVDAYRINNDVLVHQAYVVTGKQTNEAKVLRRLQKEHPEDYIVKINDMVVDEQLYGMPVDEFIKNAKPITGYFDNPDDVVETESI